MFQRQQQAESELAPSRGTSAGGEASPRGFQPRPPPLQGCSGQAGWLHWNIQARLEQPSWLLHGPQQQQRHPSPHQLCPYTSLHPHLPLAASSLAPTPRTSCTVPSTSPFRSLSTAGTASCKLQGHPLVCAGWGGPSGLVSGGTATSTHGSLAEPPARPCFAVGGSSAD